MKKRLLNILLFALILFLSSTKMKAQDAMFSQYYSSEMYLNPALAGEEQNLFFSSNYRSQWKSIVTPYITSQVSVVVPVYTKTGGLQEKHIGGIGGSVYNDRAGDGNLNTTGANATFAYNLQLTQDGSQDISFGLQVGLVQKTVDFSNLQWGEQYNPYIGFDVNKAPTEDQIRTGTIYPDISFGMMYYFNPGHEYKYRKWSAFAGVAAYHINQPNESFINDETSRLPVLFKAHAGAEYQISDWVSISPNILYMQQRQRHLLNFGAYLNYGITGSVGKDELTKNIDLIIGAWYRLDDAFIGSLGIGNDAYTLAFSYDYNTSSLRYVTNGQGAWEISLKIMQVKSHGRKKIATPRI